MSALDSSCRGILLMSEEKGLSGFSRLISQLVLPVGLRTRISAQPCVSSGTYAAKFAFSFCRGVCGAGLVFSDRGAGAGGLCVPCEAEPPGKWEAVLSKAPTRKAWPPDMDLTLLRELLQTCCPAWDSSFAGASLVCLTCKTGSEPDSVLLWRSPESRPSKDLVPVPTLVVMVTNLLPTSHVFVLPPANRNSPTGDLLGTAVKLEKTYRAIISRQVSVSSRWRFFKLSSAWAIEFSSAEPKLELVMDVCIRLEENISSWQITLQNVCPHHPADRTTQNHLQYMHVPQQRSARQ